MTRVALLGWLTACAAVDAAPAPAPASAPPAAARHACSTPAPTLHTQLADLTAPPTWCWLRTAEGDDFSGILVDDTGQPRMTYDKLGYDQRFGDVCAAGSAVRGAAFAHAHGVAYHACELVDGRHCFAFASSGSAGARSNAEGVAQRSRAPGNTLADACTVLPEGSDFSAQAMVDALVPVPQHPDEATFFAHVPVRAAKRVSPPRRLPANAAPPAGAALALRATTRPGGLPPGSEVPLWCPRLLHGDFIGHVHTHGDGTSAIANGRDVVVVDAQHRPVLDLDLGGLDAEVVDADVETGVVVAQVHPQQAGDAETLLVAIDVATGGVAWRTQPSHALANFVLARGLVVAAAGDRIIALRLDTGGDVGTVDAGEAEAWLSVAADGTLVANTYEHGVKEVVAP